MKYLVVLFSLLILAPGVRSQAVYEFKSKNLSFVPAKDWFEADKQTGPNGMTLFVFQRKAVTDSKGRSVAPTFAFIFETVQKDLDPIQYSLSRRSYEVTETFIHESGKINLKYAVGFKGTYASQGIPHTIYAVYVVNGSMGIQVLADATTDIFPVIDEELQSMLKSVKLDAVADDAMAMKTSFVSAAELAFQSYLGGDKAAASKLAGLNDTIYIHFIDARKTKSAEEKVRLYTRFLAGNPSKGLSDCYFERGSAHEDLENYDSALADYQRLVDLRPNDPSVHFIKGQVYPKKRDFLSAIAAMNTVLSLNKDFYLANFTRGASRVEMMMYDEALDDLDIVLKKDDKHVLAHFMKGKAYFGKGEYKKAISMWEKVKKLDKRYTVIVDEWIEDAKGKEKNK